MDPIPPITLVAMPALMAKEVTPTIDDAWIPWRLEPSPK